ncbi:hypothetical protein [Bacillus thuringiensis]|nr:hypothetical protein [Bacillus thuringiensis]
MKMVQSFMASKGVFAETNSGALVNITITGPQPKKIAMELSYLYLSKVKI